MQIDNTQQLFTFCYDIVNYGNMKLFPLFYFESTGKEIGDVHFPLVSNKKEYKEPKTVFY